MDENNQNLSPIQEFPVNPTSDGISDEQSRTEIAELQKEVVQEKKESIFQKTSNLLRKPVFFYPLIGIIGIVGIGLISASIYMFVNYNKDEDNVEVEQSSFVEKKRINIKASDVKVSAVSTDGAGIDPETEFMIESKQELDNNLLKEVIAIDPKVEFDVSKEDGNHYKIKVDKALKPNAIYSIEMPIVEDLEDASTKKDLSWAFQTKNPFRIVQTSPANQSTSAPTNSGIEIIFSHEDYGDISKFFSIRPNVPGKFEKVGRKTIFKPKNKFEEGKLYTVTVKKGVQLNNSSETLQEDKVFSFETAEQYKSSPYLRKYTSEFDTTDRPVFALFGVEDRKTMYVDVYKFKNGDQFEKSLIEKLSIPFWASSASSNYMYDISKIEKVSNIPNLPVEATEYVYGSYLVLPEVMPKGYYLIDIFYGEGEKVQAWFQVSDISAYLTTSDTQSSVWVIDGNTDKPINQADIKLAGNSLGKTNEKGISTFKTSESIINRTGYVFKIETAQGTLYIPNIKTYDHYDDYYYYESGEYGGGKSEDYWSHVYLDRSLYQTTDTVNFWGYIKPRDVDKSIGEFKMIISKEGYYDYFYEPIELLSQEIKLSEMNTFIGKFPIKNYKPGGYLVQIEDAEGNNIIEDSFLVETYSKPAYKIDLTSSKKAYFWDEEVKFSGQALLFEGTPVSNVELSMDGKTIKTNQNGEFNYIKKYPRTAENSTTSPISEEFYVAPKDSEVADIDASLNTLLFHYKSNLEITSKEHNGNKASIKVKMNKIDLSRLNKETSSNDADFLGEAIRNKDIKASITEEWHEAVETGEYYDYINRQTQKSYSYHLRERFYGDFNIKTNEKGEASFEFQMDENKQYKIDIYTTDIDGYKIKDTTYIYGYNYSSGYSEDYYTFEDTNPNIQNNYSYKYKIDEKINLEFKNNGNKMPIGPNSLYMYQFFQRGLFDSVFIGSSELEMTFKDHNVPNVFVKGVHFNGKSFVETYTKNLEFDTTQRALDININSDKDKYKPQEKVILSVKVKDQSGNGKSSEVNVSVVDEAMYKLIYHFAEPLSSLYMTVSSGIINTYGSHVLPPEASGGMGDTCFLPGTKILMKNYELKNIEDVRIGDTVLTKEDEGSPEMVEAKVLNTLSHKGTEYFLINQSLRVTPVHIMYVNGIWMPVKDIKVGYYLLNSSNQWEKVESIESRIMNSDIYDLVIDQKHTYFADNYYVHNKGYRQLFVDTAYFGSVVTDGQGDAKVEFTAPDNITSWRVTSQAISQDLYAGTKDINLDVTLPFFIDLVLNDQYLVGDSPIIKARSYGDQLKNDQEVVYTVNVEKLGIKDQKMTAKAFGSVDIKLDKLPEGEYDIAISAKSGEYEDGIKKTIKVKKSNLKVAKIDYQKFSENMNLNGSADGQTTVVFIDENRGRYYELLNSLYYTYGDRVDQKLTRKKAVDLLKEYFDEKNIENESINSNSYQLDGGAITLFPYSDADLELTVKVASIAPEDFDEAALKSYLYNILEKGESREDQIYALYGLASMKQPIMLPLKAIKEAKDLTLKERIYIGLATAEIGDREYARTTYKEILNKYGAQKEGFKIIADGDNYDKNIELTSLMMNLASILDESDKDTFYLYLESHSSKIELFELEKIKFMMNVLPKLSADPVEFTYDREGSIQKIKIEKGQIHQAILSTNGLAKINVRNVKGNLGILTIFDTPLTPSGDNFDKELNINRYYSVNGVKKFEFGESDIIKITLDYSIPANHPDGCYQIIDVLPSGMKIVTNPYSRGYQYNEQTRYPYSIEGQRNSFCIYKGSKYKQIEYYARIVSKGEFKAETPVIQSMTDPAKKNIISGEQTVRIR